jgi:hypothetical protein
LTKESFLTASAKETGLIDIRLGFGESLLNVVICFRQLKQTAIHKAKGNS